MATPQAPAEETDADDLHKHQLRGRIIQILSATANGCLEELGYFPGVLNQLRQSQNLNVQFKAEVAKLQDDNCRLSQSLAAHEQRASFLKAPDVARLKHLMDLEEKVRLLLDERRATTRQYETLMLRYNQLLANFNHLQSLHRITLNEITVLRTQGSRLQHPSSGTASIQTQEPVSHGRSGEPEPMVIGMPGTHPVPPLTSVVPGTVSVRRSSQPVLGHTGGRARVNTRQSSCPSISLNVQPRVPSDPRPFSPAGRPPLPSLRVLRTSNLQSHSPSVSPFRAHSPHTPFPVYFEGPAFCQQSPITPIAPSPSTSVSTTISTQDVQPRVPRDVQKSATPSTPTLSTGNQSSPIETVEALTPVDAGAPAAATSQIQSSPCKRSNEQTLETLHPSADRARKKARLGAERELHASPVEINLAPHLEENANDAESEEEVVEVDASGLRLPEHCIADVMEEDDNEDGVFSCHICNVRFKEGLIPDPPKPFVQPTQDQLMQHCVNEHPAAWELLRKNLGRKNN